MFLDLIQVFVCQIYVSNLVMEFISYNFYSSM